jgi:hypothetical protein
VAEKHITDTNSIAEGESRKTQETDSEDDYREKLAKVYGETFEVEHDFYLFLLVGASPLDTIIIPQSDEFVNSFYKLFFIFF